MALTPGTRLGPYEILSPLGQGGMGEVYRARDTRLDRLVAVKVLPAHVAGDPALKQRFEREAMTLAALSHPHICPVYDVGQQVPSTLRGSHDRPDPDRETTGSGRAVNYIVMEYLEGETLASRLEKGALPLAQALQYAIQMADALDKAHRKWIVHRDLKPGNVMLTRSGLKLLDFGLAKLQPVGAVNDSSVAATVTSSLTGHATILGTLHYMAPEQVEGKEADSRSDIFAFGAVVYEMATGKKAFDGPSAASVMAAILEREPPAMSTLQPLTPPMADHIVKRCLAKDPDERWQSASDVMRDLKWIADGAAAREGATTGPDARHRERIAWIVAALSLVLVAALAVPAALYFRRPVTAPVVTRLDVVTPPTAEAFSFALSPDGQQLAFVANGEKGSQLWLRPLDQVTAQPLAGTEGASFPFWAPDGRAIGFFADAKLKRLDLTGGALQELADAPYPRGGTWSTGGTILFAPSNTQSLMRMAATGGPIESVTRLGVGDFSHRWPQFLPDGHRFIFFKLTGQPQTNGVYAGSLDGGEQTLVMPADTAAVYAEPGYLLLSSQGVLRAYPFDKARGTVIDEPTTVAQGIGTDDGAFHSALSVSERGVLAHRSGAGSRRQLVWVDRTGNMAGVIGSPDETAPSNLAFTSNDQRVAINRTTQGNVDVWLVDVGQGRTSRFTSDGAIEAGPIWSPDGGRIVFRSSRSGVFDLFEKPVSGSADEQPLLVTPQGKSPMDWSRDGRFLLYSTQDPKTGSDLWALPLTGERKPFAVLQSNFDETAGQFSPDGRWLVYASNESGHYEVYVRTFPETEGKWVISTTGGMQPRWGPDGKEIFYVAPDNRLMAVRIRLGSDTHKLDLGVPVALFPVRLATGGNVPSSGFLARAQYAVAPDGRFLMNVVADEAGAPITIVQNWTAGLRK